MYQMFFITLSTICSTWVEIIKIIQTSPLNEHLLLKFLQYFANFNKILCLGIQICLEVVFQSK